MFCKHCGKEIDENALFCNYCGGKQKDDIENGEMIPQKENVTQKKNGHGCLIAFVGIIISIILFVGLYGGDDKVTTNSSSQTCSSQDDIAAAIGQYKSAGIIYKIEPSLNSVWVTEQAINTLQYDDFQTLGYVSACYSSYIKHNDLVWVSIYSAKTGKEIAKYSQSYGFKMK